MLTSDTIITGIQLFSIGCIVGVVVEFSQKDLDGFNPRNIGVSGLFAFLGSQATLSGYSLGLIPGNTDMSLVLLIGTLFAFIASLFSLDEIRLFITAAFRRLMKEKF